MCTIIYTDGNIHFEWHTTKAATNFEKHGYSFEEAIAVFNDTERTVFEDDRHLYGEQRFVTVGYSGKRLVVVIYTERDNFVRVISARKANKREVIKYGYRS